MEKVERSGRNPLMMIGGITIGALAALAFVGIVYYFVKNPEARVMWIQVVSCTQCLTNIGSQKFRKLIVSFLCTAPWIDQCRFQP